MAIHLFTAESLLDEVRIVRNPAGGTRAYLHAGSHAAAAELATVKQAMARRGWKTVPYSDEGRALLEVRGFKKTDEFLRCLADNGWTQGQAAITQQKDDNPTHSERLHNLTLKITGLLYNIGDVAYMGYALKGRIHEKNTLEKRQKFTTDDVAAWNIEHIEKLKKDLGSSNIKTRVKQSLGDTIEKALRNPMTKEQLVRESAEMVKGSRLNILAGIGYAIGGTALSFFGSRDQSPYEIINTTRKVQIFLGKEGVDVSPPSIMDDAVKNEDRGIGVKLKNFFSRYPSEILNITYIGVGAALSAHAYKAYRVHKSTADLVDIGLGVVTGLSAFLGIAVKEKKPVEGRQKRHGVAGFWDWIQEKPLRATGYGFMLATAFHARSSYMKYMDGDTIARKTVIYRIVFVVTNVLAEIMMAISSKGHGHGVTTDDSVRKTVLAGAAETIARQNPAQQEAIINHLAGYLSSPEILAGNAEKTATELRTQVAGVADNPWVRCKEEITEPAATAAAGTRIPSSRIDSASVSRSACRKQAEPAPHVLK